MSRDTFLCPGTLFYVRGHFFMSGDIFLCPGTFFCVSGHFFVSRDTFSCSGGSNFLSQKSPKPIGNGIVLCPVTFFGCAQRVFPGQRRKAPELFRRHRGLRRARWRNARSIVAGKNNNSAGTQTSPVTNSW